MSGPQPIINERYRTGWKLAFARPGKKQRVTGKKRPEPATGRSSRGSVTKLDRRKGKPGGRQ